MEGEWRKVRLVDISDDISYGYTASATDEAVGPRFLRITDIQGGTVSWTSVPYCSIPFSHYRRYLLVPGDIVVARTGNSTGENFLFKGFQEDVVFASYLIRFKINPLKADPRYVWYTMRSPAWWSFISGSKTGSAQAGANAKVLGTFELLLPPLPEQRAIARILGTLDDKIELNRKMNETLEAMAQALFKSWFVDFDPVVVNALKAGNAIPDKFAKHAAHYRENPDALGLPEHILRLFPDRFVDSELGPIPEGWEVGRVSDLGEVICGKTPSTKDPENYGSEVPFITIPDMHGKVYVTKTRKYLSKKGADTQKNKYLPPNSVCVSCIATPGLVVLTSEQSQTNQQINSVVPQSMSPFYVYAILRTLGEQIRDGGSGGSVFANLSKSRFSALRILVAIPRCVDRFHAVVKPLYQAIQHNEIETENLAALRDLLLPKLISGELRVTDVEKILENLL